MAQEQREFTADLAVIGSGLAGMAASAFALRRGIATAQVGNTGAIAYTTGYLDLLGASGGQSSSLLADPWSGLRELRACQPAHPLARIPEENIRAALTEFTTFLGECGIAYGAPGEANVQALTPVGTVKPTLCVPATMQAGVEAHARGAGCLIIDFKGLRGFSARQIVANLRGSWPNLAAARITFPDMIAGEVYPEVMARALEVPAIREKLATEIRAIRCDAEVIGLPAVMGVHHPDTVMSELSRLIGCPIFEIPTMPPSVPGIRLREMFEQVFPTKGLTLVPQQKVRAVDFSGEKVQLALADNFGPIVIHARTVILATGRFLSGGLEAWPDRIREPLLNIPVSQPDSREEWYGTEYMGREGHGIHRCGIEVDEQFRPLGRDGEIVDSRLFAAGVILANQDWIRGRCGAGVAIASAYKAVEAAKRRLRQGKQACEANR